MKDVLFVLMMSLWGLVAISICVHIWIASFFALQDRRLTQMKKRQQGE